MSCLKQAAEVDGISINQLISLAVAENLSALQTYQVISKQTKGPSRGSFLHGTALWQEEPIVEGDKAR